MECCLLNCSFENSLSCTVITESPVLLSSMSLKNAYRCVVLFLFSSCSKPEMYHCLKNMLVGNRERQVEGQISCKLVKYI